MRRIARLFLAGSFLLALPASAAGARPGSLDPAYGEGGAQAIEAGSFISSAKSIAVAPDGSAVAVGRGIQAGAEQVLVAKLTPTGALDAGFAGTGTLLARFGSDPGPPQRAGAVALQPDGKALVAGVAKDNWFVARYMATGALDPSFGAGGVELLRVGGGEDDSDAGPAGISVRPDGRILLVGTLPGQEEASFGSIALLGLLADGKRDPAVGGAGLAVSQLGLSSEFLPAGSTAQALELLPDGRALVAGSATDRTGPGQRVVARYLPNGRLDNSFGDRGKRVVAVAGEGVVDYGGFEGLALTPDGSIIAAGSAPRIRREAVVARLTPDGRLDQRFARRGVARMQLGFGRVPKTLDLDVAVDSAGRPVLSGGALSLDQRRSTVAVARLQADGALDCSFGRAGLVRAFAGGLDQDAAEGGAISLVVGDAVLVAGARLSLESLRAAAFVARFLGGAGTRATVARPAVTNADFELALGRGTVGLGALIDPRCSTTLWAFEYGERALTRRTKWRTIPAGAGPQDVCARLTGLRPGRRYRARLVARNRGGRANSAAVSFTAPSEADYPRCMG